VQSKSEFSSIWFQSCLVESYKINPRIVLPCIIIDIACKRMQWTVKKELPILVEEDHNPNIWWCLRHLPHEVRASDGNYTTKSRGFCCLPQLCEPHLPVGMELHQIVTINSHLYQTNRKTHWIIQSPELLRGIRINNRKTSDSYQKHTNYTN